MFEWRGGLSEWCILIKNIHGQNGGTTSHIEDNLILEDVAVLDDGIHVRPRAHLIFLCDRVLLACCCFAGDPRCIMPSREKIWRGSGRAK